MTDTNTRKSFLDLSLTQVIGGSLAAATAAALGSRLGVVGTIVGAMLVSVVSAVAGALYTQSLRRTQEMVRARELLSARERVQRVSARARRPTLRDASNPDTQVIGEAVDDVTPSIWSRVTWKAVAATAGVFFLITAVVVTGTELLTGRSLDGNHRTTVSDVLTGRAATTPTRKAPASTPTPTPTPSSTPSGSSSPVPTVPTPTPSPTVPTPSASPTDLPTGSPSPSVTPTP